MSDIGGIEVVSTGSRLLTAEDVTEVTAHIERLESENAKLRGFWTHDGTWHVEMPKLPEGIAVTMTDERDREVRTVRTWRYELERKCCLVKEHVGRSGQAHRLVCSECHHVIYDGWQEKPRYCAFCGARVEDE